MRKTIDLFLLILMSLFFLTSCGNAVGSKDINNQIMKIIIFHGVNYKVTEDAIENQNIEYKIGEVKSYSNKSGEHFVVDAFSNAFEIGTELYKITNTDIEEAIAIKNGSKYLKAIKR